MKTKLLLLCLIALSFASCKKNETVEPTYSIIGKWWLKQSILTVDEATIPWKTYINRDHTDFLLFNTDNTGSEEYTPWQQPTIKKTYTYQKVANKIILTYQDGSTNTWEIKTLNNTTMQLVQPGKDFRGALGSFEVTFTNQ